jgi:hypothetical protein
LKEDLKAKIITLDRYKGYVSDNENSLATLRKNLKEERSKNSSYLAQLRVQ